VKDGRITLIKALKNKELKNIELKKKTDQLKNYRMPLHARITA